MSTKEGISVLKKIFTAIFALTLLTACGANSGPGNKAPANDNNNIEQQNYRGNDMNYDRNNRNLRDDFYDNTRYNDRYNDNNLNRRPMNDNNYRRNNNSNNNLTPNNNNNYYNNDNNHDNNMFDNNRNRNMVR